jgi:Flp pilus assembly protein TadB
MRCPKCHAQVASFGRWALRPGPTRHCLNCGARLRYVGFYTQLAGHAVLGAIIVGLVSIFCAVTGAPDWLFVPLTFLLLAVVAGFTALLLPWRFARYKEIASK